MQLFAAAPACVQAAASADYVRVMYNIFGIEQSTIDPTLPGGKNKWETAALAVADIHGTAGAI